MGNAQTQADSPATPMVSFVRQVVPDAVMALYFVITWFSPFALGKHAPQGCMAILVMEFIAIHSAAFLMYFARAKAGVIVVVLYVPILLGVMWQFKVIWPIVFFAGHVYSTVSAMWKPSADSVVQQVFKWLASFGGLMGAMFIAAIIPWPGLGWNSMTVPDMAWSSNGNEVYHITPAWGTLYFVYLTWRGYREWKREQATSAGAPMAG